MELLDRFGLGALFDGLDFELPQPSTEPSAEESA